MSEYLGIFCRYPELYPSHAVSRRLHEATVWRTFADIQRCVSITVSVFFREKTMNSNSFFLKFQHSTYPFFPFGVSITVSSLFDLMPRCIHPFRGRHDEKKIVYKGGWF
jgi:hypothetical protein